MNSKLVNRYNAPYMDFDEEQDYEYPPKDA